MCRFQYSRTAALAAGEGDGTRANYNKTLRPRDLNRLAAGSYDLLVAGGGIHGLWCAYDAAARGLSVALIDAGDFGGAASFNHQKTAHGGLRSLQSLSLGKARESIHERRALARVAPWLLRPMPFLMGTYRSLTRGRLALRAAFALDDWLGRDRNEGLEPELHLPRPRLLSRTATTKLFPGVREQQLSGGAQWYDYQMVENDRLTFAVATAADRCGAALANYVEVVTPIAAGGATAGMRVRDVLTQTEFEINARAIVNAAGAGTPAVLAGFGIKRPVPLVRAMNLVTAKPAADMALAAPGRNGRMLTLVPWRGQAIVGTSQSPRAVDADAPADPKEIEDFIADANHAFPALRLTAGDITLVHCGLVPGVVAADGTADFLAVSQLIDHAAAGHANLVTIVGTKYTTARAVARRAVDVVVRKLAKKSAPCRTATTMLPGAAMADHEALAIEAERRLNIELPLATLRHLVGRYAEAAAGLVTLAASDDAWRAPLAPGSPAIGAEVVHAIRNESAVHLSDVVMRRTTLGAAGYPGDAIVTSAANIAARELAWTPDQTAQEISSVRSIFRLPSA